MDEKENAFQILYAKNNFINCIVIIYIYIKENAIK